MMNQMARIDTGQEAQMANAIRALAMDAVEAAKSGHPGAPMGMADVAAVLFNRFMKIDPADASWPDRDRFVMSAGHGSMLVYAINTCWAMTTWTWTSCGASASWVRAPPAIPNTAMPRASRPPPARWAKASPPPSAWRWPSG